jgi:hypothetical protein
MGYDSSLLGPLPVGQRRALAAVASSAAPGLALLSLSAGYGTWLASDSLALSVLVGVAAGLYLANLLRVSVAGGGAAAHQPVRVATTWAPRAVPLLMLALLGGFFSQPLALWWRSAEQDPAIHELQGELTRMHEAAVLGGARKLLAAATARLERASARAAVVQRRLATAGEELRELEARPRADGSEVEERVLQAALAEDRSALRGLTREQEDAQRVVEAWTRTAEEVRTGDVAVYRAHLERSHFLVRRVQLLWDEPTRPLAAALLMMLLMVLPWLTCASLGRRAQRAYELRRWASTRALVEVAYAASRRREAEALGAWPTFTALRTEALLDPPYDTRLRGGRRG